MSDRKKLQEEINKLNELYHEYDLQMSKSGAGIEQRQKLERILGKQKL